MAAKIPSRPSRIASATPTAANSDVIRFISASPSTRFRRRHDHRIPAQAGDDDFRAPEERASVGGARDVVAALAAEGDRDLADAAFGNGDADLGGSSDETRHLHFARGLLGIEELRELIDDTREHEAGDDADARRGRMREMVVARDDAADTEGGEKRRHDPRAEDARPAMIGVEMTGRDLMPHVVIAAEDFSDEEHHDEEEEAEGGNGSVNQHLSVTLPLAHQLVNAGHLLIMLRPYEAIHPKRPEHRISRRDRLCPASYAAGRAADAAIPLPLHGAGELRTDLRGRGRAG